MTTWDGRGLPPSATARMERFHASGLRTSLLSAPSAVSLDAVGFEPVGEVMGCTVMHLGWRGWAGCGYGYYGGGRYGGFSGSTAPPVQGSDSSPLYGYGPYRQALEQGYANAMRRMCTEAQAMGADGVVGVRLTAEHHTGFNSREFTAMGTAVRGRSSVRAPYPFTTELSGTDTAKLLQAGWTPVQLRFGIEVAIRHDDAYTRQQAGRSAFNWSNNEVFGYTELVQFTRAKARDRLTRSTRQTGADGVVLHDVALRVWEIEPSDGHTDHVAESTFRGTAIARFHKPAVRTTDTLTILPLRGRKRFGLDGN